MASKTTVARLMRDIRRIEDDLLSTDNDDEEMRLLLLQRKRDHLVRGLILDVHLQIDDLLSVALRNAILAGRSRRTTMRKEVDHLLEGSRSLRFPQKVLLARTLGWLSPKRARELQDLNSVRNACGHGWQLSKLKRRGVKRAAPKPPMLRYQGKNLYKTEALTEFIAHFQKLYLDLYVKLDV